MNALSFAKGGPRQGQEDAPGDDETWAAKFKVMKENLEHHIGEEEGEMFKQAKQVSDQDELTSPASQ